MTIFERIFLSKGTKKLLRQKALQTGVKYEIINGQIVTPADNKTEFINSGYKINDIVYSIINIILDKVRLPEWGLFKVADESSLKGYNSIMKKTELSAKDYKRALKLKDEALEPITSFNTRTGKLYELLKYPNEDETMSEQVANGSGYKLVTGDVYLWGEQMSGGANDGIPDSIELLPSHFITIKGTNTFPTKAVSYELLSWNQKFTKESILHEKYWNPDWSINGSQLYGMSPLRSALMNLSRNNSAKTASAYKFKNNGLEAIIFPDDDRWTVEEGLEQAAAIKAKINSAEYNGPQSFGKIAASGIKMGTVPLGLSPVELGIIDSEKWDALMLCSIYNVPPELFGLVQKTYNNVVEAEKALTTRSAIPLLNARRNSLNRKLQTDWGFKGQNVYVDYSTECFTELESNIEKVVSWTSKLIAISPNEERELAGLESDPDPIMDEKWILSGGSRVPLSDFKMGLVDQTLNNEVQQTGNGTLSANGQGKDLFTGTYKANGIEKIIPAKN